MAFIKLQFRPGLNLDQTSYSNEGGWGSCDKIRFRSGYPQKLGGWVKNTSNSFYGACRQMCNWVTTFSDNFLGIGTNSKLYIEAGGYYYDITPLRLVNPVMSSPDTNNSISTTINSNTVTVTLGAAYDAITWSFVTISGVSGDVGGVPQDTLNANHQITALTSTSFSFEVPMVATSTVSMSGGTAIEIAFEIEPGFAINTEGYGWGTGTWGRGSWGLGSTTPILLPQRDWWLGNYDNDLFANIRNGPIYWWSRGTDSDPVPALDSRAITLQQYATATGFDPNAVPAAAMQVLLSQQDRQLIAFGAVPFGSTDIADFDPLLIRWADQSNPGQWTPEVTNSSGFLRVSRGSRIVRAIPARQEILVWTDTNLYTLQFLGTTDVFGLQEYADGISVMSPRAFATASNITYWMGQDRFYAYTGRVETLPCTLRDHIFNNINLNQASQVVCGTNEQWNEVWWFYPTADSDWNNAYVIYNHLEKLWYYGSLDRLAWLDTSLREFPIASTTNTTTLVSYNYNHEDGVDDDALPMEAFIQSSDFDIADGEQFMLSRRIIPDISFDGSTSTTPEATFDLRGRDFPGSAFLPDGEDSGRVVSTVVDQYTTQLFIRLRARQMAIKISSEDLGVQWQLGAPRLDCRVDGRR